MIDLNVNLCLTYFGGSGDEVKGQTSIKEIGKKSSQKLITCESSRQDFQFYTVYVSQSQ